MKTRDKTFESEVNVSKFLYNDFKIDNNTKLKTPNNILLKKILRQRIPIDLIILHALDKLSDIFLIKNDNYFSKKNIQEVFKKIYFHKTKAYKNIFEQIRSYNNRIQCFFCRKWIFKTHFHQHIDECKNNKIEKDYCIICKRHVVQKIVINDKSFHQHFCTRGEKNFKQVTIKSKNRWKRRQLGEKKIFKKIIRREVFDQLNGRYLKKIISNFVNQRRLNILKKIENIKNGYPEEYLNLYQSDTDFPYHFYKIFKNFIGIIGRFYGDTIKQTYFDTKKEFEFRKKYQLNFKFINCTANDEEIKYIQEQIRLSLSKIKEMIIPKFRKVKIYRDLMKTYLIACAERRKIDEETKTAFIKITKLKKNKNEINFVKIFDEM